MSGGSKREEDKLGISALVAIGVGGSVVVAAMVFSLEGWFMTEAKKAAAPVDVSAYQSMTKTQQASLDGSGTSPYDASRVQIPVAKAIKLVAEGAAVDAANLVPAVGRSDKATVAAEYGRPKPLAAQGTPAASSEPSPAMVTPPTAPPTAAPSPAPTTAASAPLPNAP